MLVFKKGTPPYKADTDVNKRRAQIEEILLLMEVDHYAEIEINNLPAWCVSFHHYRERVAPGKKFVRRKGDHEGDQTFQNIYTIWRKE